MHVSMHDSVGDTSDSVGDTSDSVGDTSDSVGDTSDSRFEAVVDEIMHFRPPSCAHHSTSNVYMLL